MKEFCNIFSSISLCGQREMTIKARQRVLIIIHVHTCSGTTQWLPGVGTDFEAQLLLNEGAQELTVCWVK